MKCDRQSPCDQCIKRGIESTCQFIPYVSGGPRGGQTGTVDARLKDASSSARSKFLTNESAVQSRLKHLEHLVQVLKAQRRGNGANEPSEAPVREPLPEEEFEDEVLLTLGQRVRETAGNIFGEMRYVDSSHWEAILSDVSYPMHDRFFFFLLCSVSDCVTPQLLSITGSIEPLDEPGLVEDQDSPPAPSFTQPRGPDLLLGGFSRVPISDLAQYLPPRTLADRLLARLFQAKEPGAVMFHMPTFLKQYEGFWENPAAMTYTQLGLLFAMFCSASLYYMRVGEEVPGGLGNPHEIYKTYKAKCAQCLVLDDYTKPGPYKLEALILYFGCEYLGHPDATTSASVILSIIVRLAMHMGLHRDPRHYPSMSPFEGEMRRRVWVALRDVDILIAFQFGLPGNIHNDLYDTELPRNLHDEDFDQDSKELPPSRPETERTVMLWCIVKGRIVNVFSAISTAMSARKPATFANIMHLDRQLEEVHNDFPPCLRYRSFSQSVADPVDIIMQRFQLELLYLKSRIVLHRRCMGFARKGKRYEQSRRICLDAATRILRHQYDINVELQLGGRLSHDRSHWFLSSLSTHNFLLADMILCIELWCLKAKERSSLITSPAAETLANDTSPEIMSQEQILEILRTSRLIWQGRRKESAEANRAFNILTKMLSMSTGETFHDSPESSGSGSGSVAESLERMYPTLPLMAFAMETGPSPTAMAASVSSASGSVQGGRTTLSSGEELWTSPVGKGTGNGDVMAGWNAQWGGSGMGMQPVGDGLDGFLDPNSSSDWVSSYKCLFGRLWLRFLTSNRHFGIIRS